MECFGIVLTDLIHTYIKSNFVYAFIESMAKTIVLFIPLRLVIIKGDDYTTSVIYSSELLPQGKL